MIDVREYSVSETSQLIHLQASTDVQQKEKTEEKNKLWLSCAKLMIS
jgi:hypothetical protein